MLLLEVDEAVREALLLPEALAETEAEAEAEADLVEVDRVESEAEAEEPEAEALPVEEAGLALVAAGEVVAAP